MLRKIAALSIPAVITNITTPILAITDVTIMGHIGDAVFLAAIAVGATMFNMLYWLCGFLRMGASGLTAQAFGAKDTEETFVLLMRGIVIAFAIGMSFIIFRNPIADGILSIMDTDSTTRLMAKEYFAICVWGAPAMLGSFALTGWFIGMQDTRIPMWVSIFTDAFNILLSVTLVFAFKMGMPGVAFGTLAAQWAGFMAAVWLGVHKYGFHIMPLSSVMQAERLKRFFRVNSDIFLRTLCLVAVTMWFTRTGASQGTLMLAVNALLMQLFTIGSFFMDGIAFAGEALCGRYSGASDCRSLHRAVRYLLTTGGVLAIIFSLLYGLFGNDFIQLMSSDTNVTRHAGRYMVWAALIPIAGFGAFIWDGIFIGLTRTRAMLGSMLAATAVFFCVYLAAFPLWDNNGLWIALLSYLFTRGAVLTVVGRVYLRETD